MKTSLRIFMMVLMVMVAASSMTYANANSKPSRPSKSKKRGVETSFYSRQMYQAKYSKCPRFSTKKRASK